MPKRKKLNGTWHGVYNYDPLEIIPKLPSVGFTMVLKQHWFGIFSGTVEDNPPFGIPGTGSINGDFSYPLIRFTKRMPVSYVLQPDGQRITLRENIIALGHQCEHELPGPDILYHGKFTEPNRAEGTWVINPKIMRLPGSKTKGIKIQQLTGTWNIAFEGP